MAQTVKTLLASHQNGLLRLLVCIASVILFATDATAQKNRWGYDRIEEDWELVLATPDGQAGSPQIEFQMKPEPNSSLTGMFLINYHDTPAYTAGGVQIQMWDRDINIATADFPASTLSDPDEAIPFTLYMDRSTGNLRYGVCAGHSTAWGDLSGGSEEICVEVPDNATSFPKYDTGFSLRNTEIVFGATRIKSLRLKEVRKYYTKGNSYDTDTTIYQVYP